MKVPKKRVREIQKVMKQVEEQVGVGKNNLALVLVVAALNLVIILIQLLVMFSLGQKPYRFTLAAFF